MDSFFFQLEKKGGNYQKKKKKELKNAHSTRFIPLVPQINHSPGPKRYATLFARPLGLSAFFRHFCAFFVFVCRPFCLVSPWKKLIKSALLSLLFPLSYILISFYLYPSTPLAFFFRLFFFMFVFIYIIFWSNLLAYGRDFCFDFGSRESCLLCNSNGN